LFEVAVNGDPDDGEDDFVLAGSFAVKAVLPGFDASLALGEADLIITWPDADTPEGVTVTARAEADQEFVDFLETSSQQLLDALILVRDTLSLFDADIPYVSDSLNQLIDWIGIFQDKVLDPLQDPVSGSASIPTLQELAAMLAAELGIDLSDLGLRYGPNPDTGANELTFTIDVGANFSSSGLFDLGLGTTAGGTTIDVSGLGNLRLTFGIDIDLVLDGADIDDYFFIRDVDLSGSLDVVASGLDSTTTAGPLSVIFDSGSIAGSASFAIALKDPEIHSAGASAGRIDLGELFAGFVTPSLVIGDVDISGTADLTGVTVAIDNLLSMSGNFSVSTSSVSSVTVGNAGSADPARPTRWLLMSG
jgi:hypothetical protein